MAQELFSYKRSITPQKFGIRPRINQFLQSRPLHYHDFFEIEMIASGSLTYEINGVIIPLSAGDVVAVSPGDIHKYDCIEPTRVYRCAFMFKDTCHMIQRLLSQSDFPFVAHYEKERFDEISEIFYKLMDDIQASAEHEREIIGGRATVFLALCMSERRVINTKIPDSYNYVARAMRYVSENCASPLTLGEVAKHVNVSESYLSRIFLSINGRSFVEYLTAQRIENAKKMLATNSDSITTIAFASGFGSFPSFSRAFLKHVGITPSEYRKHVKGFD